MKTIFSLLASLVLLTGCQMPQYMWYKPGGNPQQHQADVAECRLRALELPAQPRPQPIVPVYQPPSSYNVRQNYTGNYTVTPEAQYDTAAGPNAVSANLADYADQARREQYFRACMEAKGYTRIRTAPQGTP